MLLSSQWESEGRCLFSTDISSAGCTVASHLIFLLGRLAQTFLSSAAVNLLSLPKLTLPPQDKLWSLPQAPGVITTASSMSSFPLPCTYIKNKQKVPCKVPWLPSPVLNGFQFIYQGSTPLSKDTDPRKALPWSS